MKSHPYSSVFRAKNTILRPEITLLTKPFLPEYNHFPWSDPRLVGPTATDIIGVALRPWDWDLSTGKPFAPHVRILSLRAQREGLTIEFGEIFQRYFSRLFSTATPKSKGPTRFDDDIVILSCLLLSRLSV
jgi:hypothetical protein